MKTATEILFEDCKIIGGDNPSPDGRDSFICVVTFDVIQAMEQYAKQEALEFLLSYQKSMLHTKLKRPVTNTEYWNEYQKSKLKK